LDDAEQISVRILEDDEVRPWAVSPGIPRRSQREQPFDLRVPVGCVEIEVQPVAARPSTIARLKGEIWPAFQRIAQYDPASAGGFPRDVSESVLPEFNGSVEFVAMHDDRSDAYHAS
jgi:hypothetical protein